MACIDSVHSLFVVAIRVFLLFISSSSAAAATVAFLNCLCVSVMYYCIFLYTHSIT